MIGYHRSMKDIEASAWWRRVHRLVRHNYLISWDNVSFSEGPSAYLISLIRHPPGVFVRLQTPCSRFWHSASFKNRAVSSLSKYLDNVCLLSHQPRCSVHG